MAAPLTFELFDRFGKFVMPTPAQISDLESETQQRFAAVQSAAAELETATEARKVAEQGVIVALAERDNSEAALRALRPKVDATAEAKRWIASQRAEA